jgi:hypothetical protein
MLHLYDEQIAIRGIQQFSLLGRTDSGSRAVADVQSQPYYEGLRALAGEIAQSKTKQAFRRFVDVNFGPQYDLPTLRFSKIARQPIADLATALANLSSAGFTFSDTDTQNDLRGLMELPELPDVVKTAIEPLADAGLGVVPAPPSIPRAALPEGSGLRG